jgi:hypothetical protein
VYEMYPVLRMFIRDFANLAFEGRICIEERLSLKENMKRELELAMGEQYRRYTRWDRCRDAATSR